MSNHPGRKQRTVAWQATKRDAMESLGRTIDVWLCMACGIAFPCDHPDIQVKQTFQVHLQCPASGNRNQGQMKHVGLMSSKAAGVLCGPRFRREAAPPVGRPPALVATIGERVKLAPVPAPTSPVAAAPPPVGELCVSCGEALVDGGCPFNTADWPHAVSR